MAKSTPRAPVSGPTFIRLLARLTDVEVPQTQPVLSEQLSQWIDWTRAVALSRALDGAPVAEEGAPGSDAVDDEECARARAALVQSITRDPTLATTRQREEVSVAGDAPRAEKPVDFSIYRERHLSFQRAMLSATGRLRGRLRDRLAASSTDLARLAEVDAVMEQTLSPREQRLLASIPTLLGDHFERLRQAAQATPDDGSAAQEIPTHLPGAWLDVFRQDMQNVLLAELDVRFQPVDGLLAALRTR